MVMPQFMLASNICCIVSLGKGHIHVHLQSHVHASLGLVINPKILSSRAIQELLQCIKSMKSTNLQDCHQLLW